MDEVVANLTSGDRGKRVVLFGRPWVGKSSVARAAVHLALESGRWGTVVWMDLDSHSLVTPAQPRALRADGYDDATRDLAIAIGDGKALRARPRDRSSYLSRILSQDTFLIVVDNVPDGAADDFVDLLLRAPTTVDVLFTTTPRPTWDVKRIEIMPIDASLAGQVFSRWTTTAISEEMTRHAAGVPGLMRAIAKLKEEGYSDEELLEPLQRGPGSVASMMYASEWNKLRGSAAQRLTMATVFGTASPIREIDALEILQRLQPRTRSIGALAELKRRGLIAAEDGEIAVDPVARGYFLSKLEGTRAIAQIRLAQAEWLADRTSVAGQLDDYGSMFHAMDGLKDHYFSLISTLEQVPSLTVSSPPDSFAELSYFLFCRGYWSELLSWSQVRNRCGMEDITPEAIWDDLNWVVKVVRLRDGDEAARQFLRSRLNGLPDSITQRAVGSVAGATLRQRTHEGEREVARELDKNADQLLEEHEFRWAITALLRAGNVYRELGEAGLALDRTERAIALLDAAEKSAWAREVLALADGNKGIIANTRGDWGVALDLFLGRSGELAQLADRGIIWSEISRAYEGLGQNADCLESYRITEAIARELGISSDMSESMPGWAPRP